MPGLSPSLLLKLRKTLLDIRWFKTDDLLQSLFADTRISPWQDEVPQANIKSERVDLFINAFIDRHNKYGQSFLGLFLQAVCDKEVEEDAFILQIKDLSIEVACALDNKLPPLARNNLLRASAVYAGEPAGHLGGFIPSPPEAEPNPQVASLPPGLPAKLFAERLESLKNKEKADWLPVDFLEKGLQAARAVGRVEFQGRKLGTAFLIAPDLVLTNRHVVGDLPNLSQGGVRFNVGLQGDVQWRYFTRLETDSAVEELDFALLRLAAPAPGAPLTLSTEACYKGQAANILQYPEGGPMQVALRCNEVLQVDPKRLYYVTDTDEGSSGSPVFNDDWQVIALHRAGIEDDAKHKVKYANQGIPLTAIQPLIHPYLKGG
jgi:hypothetical protein